MSENVPILLK